jgi:hypothetical protein
LCYAIGQVPGGKKVVSEPLSITVRSIVTIWARSKVLKGSKSCGAVTMAVDRTKPHRSFSAPSVPPGMLGLQAIKERAMLGKLPKYVFQLLLI